MTKRAAFNISLTLNGETRTLRASPYGNDTIIVGGIEMTTISGKKSHVGIAIIKDHGQDHEYDVYDICEVSYHGMRGNHGGRRSNMRYIGFPAS